MYNQEELRLVLMSLISKKKQDQMNFEKIVEEVEKYVYKIDGNACKRILKVAKDILDSKY